MKLEEIIEFNNLLSSLSISSLDSKKSIKTYKLLSEIKKLLTSMNEGRKTFMEENKVEKTPDGNWNLGKLLEQDKETYEKVLTKLQNESKEELEEEIIKDVKAVLNYLTYEEFSELVRDKKITVVVNTKDGGQEKVEKDIIYSSSQSALLYDFLVIKNDN